MAAHRLLLLRLTDSRNANHMCVPPTSTSAPLSSAVTFPPALVVSFSFLSRSPYPYRPSTCPRPRERNGSPTAAALFSAASKNENPVHHLCADSPWYAQHQRSTRCAPNPFQCILPVWLRQRVMGRLGHRHSACTCPRQRCSLPFHFVCLLARTSAPPSHLSIPLPPLLHRVLSRAGARKRARTPRVRTRKHAQQRRGETSRPCKAFACARAPVCVNDHARKRVHTSCLRRSSVHSPLHPVISASCARKQAATTIAQFSAWTRRRLNPGPPAC